MFPSSCDGKKTPTLLGPLERANLNHWASHHLRMEIDPVSKMFCFLVFRIADDGQSPEPR
jgi:hypothetical protein